MCFVVFVWCLDSESVTGGKEITCYRPESSLRYERERGEVYCDWGPLDGELTIGIVSSTSTTNTGYTCIILCLTPDADFYFRNKLAPSPDSIF